jgi:hypothetical protein
VEFDPTNGLIAGRNLLRVCTARSPEQAIPVAGGFVGRPTDFIGMTVNVAVTVGIAGERAPAAEPASDAALPEEPLRADLMSDASVPS